MKLPEIIKQRSRKLRKNSTPQEILLWSRLKNRRFKNLKFRRQHPLGKYIVDFICLEKKLLVELDGWQHKQEDHKRYDLKRTTYLRKQKFKIVRFWNNEVNKNLDGVLLKIEEMI